MPRNYKILFMLITYKLSAIFPVSLLMGYSLERKNHFLSEQRTEPYKGYGEGVAQVKNGFGAKSTLQSQALLEFERCGE
jgi:hypothetical protein